jgi:hypothetical protein
MMTTPFLEDSEIDRICAPLTQNAAKVRYLRSMGLPVIKRRNGRPEVSREVYEAMQRGIQSTQDGQPAPRQPVGPDRAGLVLQFNRRTA